MPRQVGTVVVYRPGVFDPAKVTAGGPVEIDGRPGFYQESLEWNRLGLADRPPLTVVPDGKPGLGVRRRRLGRGRHVDRSRGRTG